jgi:hypothetical protein
LVAISAEQGFAGRTLELPFVGLRIALLEVDAPVAEAEQRDQTIAIEELVLIEHRRELLVGVHAVESAVELGGDLAFHLHVQNVAFEAQRFEDAGKGQGVGKVCHGGAPVSGGIRTDAVNADNVADRQVNLCLPCVN